MQNTHADTWLRLNQINPAIPEGPNPSESESLFSDALQYFTKHSQTNIINLRTLTPAQTNYLENKGIVIKYLAKNFGTHGKRRNRHSRTFQLDAVRKKAIQAFCPFCGELAESSHSLLANLNTIFYRFQTEEVFYVVTAGIGYGFEKQALYFPHEEIVITTGESWGFEEEDLAELKARMVSNFTLCREYLSDQNRERQKIALCIGFYHFAHHLWNELSGIQRLNKAMLLNEIDKFLVMREPLGDLGQLFPEMPTGRIQRMTNTAELFGEILRHRYFAIRVGDNFVTRDLVARVYKVACSNCLPATRERVRKAREVHSPMLWIGIRVESRTWSDQADGLAKLITSLHERFPRLGVVFDGFSLPADRCVQSTDRQEYADIINRERAVVKEITEKLKSRKNGIGIFDIVGSSIFDANIWAHAIDAYVSSYGSLQHKVGWLANNRGIIHANQSLLQNPPRNVWAAVEDAIVPRYVRLSSVSDIRFIQTDTPVYKQLNDYREVGAGNRTSDKKAQVRPEFNNYTVEWKPLLEDLVDLLQSRNFVYRLIRPIVIKNLKRRLKRVLQTLTRAVAGSET